jgi:uncharacterized protein YdhG (YjbR/CyaY superfamily)
MNIAAETINDYLKQIPAETVATVKKVLARMKKHLPGAKGRVQWGIAIYSINGKDVVGLAARSKLYSLYVPHGEIVRKYVPRLGKVTAGKGCIRFRSLDDLNLAELDRMVKELKSRIR